MDAEHYEESSQAGSTLKLRRCKSVTQAEEIVKHDQQIRKSQPDKPIHKPMDSLFSWSSTFNDFTGFVNWGFLLLTIGGIRLTMENLIKYGIRIDPHQWLILFTEKDEGGPEHPAVILIAYSFIPMVFCLLVEKALAREVISTKVGMTAHVMNLLMIVLVPIIAIHVMPQSFSLVGATSVCFLYCILFLKLWSYVQVNMWCRHKISHKKSHIRRQSMSYGRQASSSSLMNGGSEHLYPVIHYPRNLHLKDLLYFLGAPTLCYELNFPKTSRIRKRFLIKRFLEVIIGFQVVVSLFQQWIIPSVKNSLIPFSNMDVAKGTERLLKLAIPNHLVWLCWFYLFFHSFLNLTGELLHFADRNFYSDWWNATSIDKFWRSWNMPAHRWAVRHLYLPLIALGFNKETAVVAVFFTSAFFHEYLISVPLKTFKLWAFMLMMWQIPLSYLSRYMEVKFGPRVGNCMVWAGLILGQPLCIMIYYHDYVITHFGEALIEAYAQI